MKKGGEARVVLVTCGSLKEARMIGQSVVTKRLAACVNVSLATVESVYRWRGKVEKAREHLLMMKTTAGRLVELEREVKRLHSYDVAEFVALKVWKGSKEYLEWIGESVGKGRKGSR
ncbi:MAG TPA: divalent-cation tolerance protein CutA [Candidatus Dormibacteraeota bacterium]|nr:divalent-cation tolerance protein CutA [Candidatus Dormibacteraeota bacterium]